MGQERSQLAALEAALPALAHCVRGQALDQCVHGEALAHCVRGQALVHWAEARGRPLAGAACPP